MAIVHKKRIRLKDFNYKGSTISQLHALSNNPKGLPYEGIGSNFNQLIFPRSHSDLFGVGKLNVPVHFRIDGSEFIPQGFPIL